MSNNGKTSKTFVLKGCLLAVCLVLVILISTPSSRRIYTIAEIYKSTDETHAEHYFFSEGVNIDQQPVGRARIAQTLHTFACNFYRCSRHERSLALDLLDGESQDDDTLEIWRQRIIDYVDKRKIEGNALFLPYNLTPTDLQTISVIGLK